MKSGILTFRLNQVQKLLDHGFPVVMGGIEYFQIHQLFQRAEVTRDGKLVGHRAIAAQDGRFCLLDKVSKMTNEEVFSIQTLLAMNEKIDSFKPVMEMLIEAIDIQKGYFGTECAIRSYLNDSGNEVKLNKPVKGKIHKNSGELPFLLAFSDMDLKGARVEHIDTIWTFIPNDDIHQMDGLKQGELYEVYGSEHSIYTEKAKPPLISYRKSHEEGYSPI